MHITVVILMAFVSFVIDLLISSDEVRVHLGLLDSGRQLLLAEPYTLDEERHVSAERSHGV